MLDLYIELAIFNIKDSQEALLIIEKIKQIYGSFLALEKSLKGAERDDFIIE